jgi:hypothetical protein
MVVLMNHIISPEHNCITGGGKDALGASAAQGGHTVVGAESPGGVSARRGARTWTVWFVASVFDWRAWTDSASRSSHGPSFWSLQNRYSGWWDFRLGPKLDEEFPEVTINLALRDLRRFPSLHLPESVEDEEGLVGGSLGSPLESWLSSVLLPIALPI